MPRISHWDFSGKKNSKWVEDQESSDGSGQDGKLQKGAKLSGEGSAEFDGKNDYMHVWETEAFKLDEGTVTMSFTPDTLISPVNPEFTGLKYSFKCV